MFSIGAILGITASCLVLVILLIIKSNKIRTTKKKKVHATKESISRTMSGNLVVEQTNIPIETIYHLRKTKIGRGSSAQVIVGVHHHSRRKYAIKIIDTTIHNSKKLFERYNREKNILRDIDHSNIIRLFEVYLTDTAQYFVMELCTGGHLGQVLARQPEGRLTIEVAKQYILQITRAISHLHGLNICHRDIKLQNILLESGEEGAQIKLIDFGNSWRFKKGKFMTKIVGTTYTAAPEVLRECYDERCDVWSVGVVAYILLSGRRPFESLDIPGQPQSRESSLIAAILMGRFHFHHETWEDVPPIAIHFVKWCLEMDFKKRKSSVDLLQHPWLGRSDLHAALGVGISREQANVLHRRLSQNKGNCGLRRTSMVAVAFSMPANKMSQMREMFQQIDKDGTGTLELEEFHEAMLTVDPTMIPEDIDLLFESMDIDGDKHISFLEFVAATVDPREVDIQEVNQAFRLLDKDNKGYISKTDLARLLGTSSNDDHEIQSKAKLDKTGSGSRSGSGSTSLVNRTYSDRNNSITNLSKGTSAVFKDENMTDGIATTSRDGSIDSNYDQRGPSGKQQVRKLKLNEKIQTIIDQSDVDKDGVISYAEFLLAMSGSESRPEQLQKNPSGSNDIHNKLMMSSHRPSSISNRAGSGGGGGSYPRLASGASCNSDRTGSKDSSSQQLPPKKHSGLLSANHQTHSQSSIKSGSISSSSSSSDDDYDVEMKVDVACEDGDIESQVQLLPVSPIQSNPTQNIITHGNIAEQNPDLFGGEKNMARRRQSDGLLHVQSHYSRGGRTVTDNLHFAKIHEDEEHLFDSITSIEGASSNSFGFGFGLHFHFGFDTRNYTKAIMNSIRGLVTNANTGIKAIFNTCGNDRMIQDKKVQDMAPVVSNSLVSNNMNTVGNKYMVEPIPTLNGRNDASNQNSTEKEVSSSLPTANMIKTRTHSEQIHSTGSNNGSGNSNRPGPMLSSKTRNLSSPASFWVSFVPDNQKRTKPIDLSGDDDEKELKAKLSTMSNDMAISDIEKGYIGTRSLKKPQSGPTSITVPSTVPVSVSMKQALANNQNQSTIQSNGSHSNSKNDCEVSSNSGILKGLVAAVTGGDLLKSKRLTSGDASVDNSINNSGILQSVVSLVVGTRPFSGKSSTHSNANSTNTAASSIKKSSNKKTPFRGRRRHRKKTGMSGRLEDDDSDSEEIEIDADESNDSDSRDSNSDSSHHDSDSDSDDSRKHDVISELILNEHQDKLQKMQSSKRKSSYTRGLSNMTDRTSIDSSGTAYIDEQSSTSSIKEHVSNNSHTACLDMNAVSNFDDAV